MLLGNSKVILFKLAEDPNEELKTNLNRTHFTLALKNLYKIRRKDPELVIMNESFYAVS